MSILKSRIPPAMWMAGALLAPTSATAQAFLQDAGHGRVITSAIYSHSDKGFDDNGNARDIADYDQFQVYFLGELGVTKDVTLLVTPSYRYVNVKNGNDSSGPGYTDVGARVGLVNHASFVLSAQGLIRIPGDKRRDNQAQVGSTDAEYDLRLQGAKTFDIGRLPSFVILEGAYRLRDGQPPNELHLDMTLGARPTDRLLLLLSNYNTVSDGEGIGIFANRYHYNSVYASGAYDVSKNVSLQLGIQGTVAGRNALRERGLFGGVWFRF